MTTFAFIGDSVTADTRTGAWGNGQGWAALVCSRYPATKQNFAVSGNNTSQIASQLSSALATNPDALFIMAGENDIPTTSVSTFKSELDGIVVNALVQLLPSQIVLLTPFIYENSAYLSAAPAYLQAIRDVAVSRGVGLVDVFDRFSEFYMTRSDYSNLVNPDGHPTIAGHVEIANLFNLSQYSTVEGYTATPILPSNQIPVMTADTTSGVTMAGNNIGEVSGPTQGALVYVICGGPPQNIQFNQNGTGWVTWAFPSAFLCSSYKVGVRPEANAQAYSPKTWTFEGSNDGVTWTTLDTQTALNWQQGEVRQYSLTTSTSYSHYRYNVSSSQSGTGSGIVLHLHSFEILK